MSDNSEEKYIDKIIADAGVLVSIVGLLIVAAVDWRWIVPVLALQFVAFLTGWCAATGDGGGEE